MLLPRLALGAVLLATPLLSLAQTTAEPPATPRFYVGLSAYNSYYQRLGKRFFIEDHFQVPVQVTAGYQWTPRLAVQVGVAYSGFSRNYSFAGNFYTGPNTPLGYYESTGRYKSRAVSASALARYTLTRKAAHRVQFDALGGLTLERFGSRSRGTRSDSVQTSLVSAPYDNRFSNTTVLATLGVGVRYRLSPRLELTYDFTANRALGPTRNGYLFRDITSSQALGLRYRFGSR